MDNKKNRSDSFENNNSEDIYFDSLPDEFKIPQNLTVVPYIPKNKPTKKNHKIRNGIIFLTILSLVFIACTFHFTEKNNEKPAPQDLRKITEQEPPQSQSDISTSPELLTIQQLAEEDARYEIIYQKSGKYSKSILNSVIFNSELLDFTIGYPENISKKNVVLTDDELSDGIPLFIQWDDRWGYIPYGDDVIGYSGCGPVCLSMAAVYLTKNPDFTPDRIAEFAEEKGFYQPDSGTSWELMTKGCENFGLVCEELPLNENRIIRELKKERPIICSMNPGDFTLVGHFIVISGIKDGKFTVNDPNSRIRSQRLWSYDELEWQIRNLWSFTEQEQEDTDR